MLKVLSYNITTDFQFRTLSVLKSSKSCDNSSPLVTNGIVTATSVGKRGQSDSKKTNFSEFELKKLFDKMSDYLLTCYRHVEYILYLRRSVEFPCI